MKLRPDCRRESELRKISIVFPSRLGVVIVSSGQTVVQAVVQEKAVLMPDIPSHLLRLNLESTEDYFFVERAVRYILPVAQLSLTPNKSRYISVFVSTLERSSPPAALHITAIATALLHYGLQVAFIPICVFSRGQILDVTDNEGETTLRTAFDKGGNAYMTFGDSASLLLHIDQARDGSQSVEDAVLDDLQQRRIKRRAEYLLQ